MRKASAIALVVVLLLVVLVGIGRFFTYSGPAAPNGPESNNNTQSQLTPTQVIAYVPEVPASSTRAMSGSCWTSSIAAPFRTDAWRCSVGNSISDPCFQIPGSKNLLCGMDPASPVATTSTFVLKLTQPLPVPEAVQGPVPSNWAWLVQLSDGTPCSPFTGSLPIAQGGISANYGCAPQTPGGEGILIFGDLNTSSSVWMADVGNLSPVTSSLPIVVNPQVIPVAKVWQ